MVKIEKSNIKDSGYRRTFKTGAVRDIVDGKGRCDLMPLHEIAGLLGKEELPFTTIIGYTGLHRKRRLRYCSRVSVQCFQAFYESQVLDNSASCT